MERWKRVTRKAYENHAQEYMEQTKTYWEIFPGAKKMMNLFLELLPEKQYLTSEAAEDEIALSSKTGTSGQSP